MWRVDEIGVEVHDEQLYANYGFGCVERHPWHELEYMQTCLSS